MDNPGKHCKIWAVGGGKGGTGKSFISSSAGTCLALKGNKTILLDADLGGANLHSFFGLNRPRYSLSDFFDNKIPLRDIIVPSGIANLGLITGSIGSLDSESINHAQKQKLFRHKRPAAPKKTAIMDDELSDWIKNISCFTGGVLRNIRERMGVDLKDIFAVSRIQPQYLDDIENEQFGSFRAEVYLRSYIIEYTRFLSLDTQKVLADYLPRYRKFQGHL